MPSNRVSDCCASRATRNGNSLGSPTVKKSNRAMEKERMMESNETEMSNSASQATTKANQIWSKYMASCGKIYDFFAMICRGQRKHTPETLKVSQKRGSWIVTIFIVLALIGAFMDDDEETMADTTTASETVLDNTDSDSKISMNTTKKQKHHQSIGRPKTFKKVSPYYFSSMMFSEEPGTAMWHNGGIKIISVVADGVIVYNNDKTAFIKTSRSGYVDGNYLNSGAYVRKGSYTYSSADGARRTVPAFEEITNKRELEIFKALLEQEKESR